MITKYIQRLMNTQG